jgi:hypothetical protein
MTIDYIPLLTDDYKLAFCQATNGLCTDVQRLIWEEVIVTEPVCPPAPKKLSRMYLHLKNRSVRYLEK